MYFIRLAQYWLSRMRRGDIRLVMTILVKNEADIIEDNIRFHAKQGVDGFVVMDNCSTDGTREILTRLQSEFDLHVIDQKSQNYQQAKWMTELAVYARKHAKADLVISNDADEFWRTTSKDKTLKELLARKDSVVTVKKFNMALSDDALNEGYRYHASDLVIKNPICFDSTEQRTSEQISMLLIKVSPKTIVNPHGLIRLAGGNHRAKHVWRPYTKRVEPNIHVYHFPVRGYKQFEANIINRKRLLETKKAVMGDHYKRWVRLYDEGKLYDEFQRFILKQDELTVLTKLGVIERRQPIDLSVI